MRAQNLSDVVSPQVLAVIEPVMRIRKFRCIRSPDIRIEGCNVLRQAPIKHRWNVHPTITYRKALYVRMDNQFPHDEPTD